MEEARAASAQLFRRLDAHDAQPEQPVNERTGQRGLLVHFADLGADLVVGELVHAVTEQPFVLGQYGQRQRRHATDVSTGNGRRVGWKRLI